MLRIDGAESAPHLAFSRRKTGVNTDLDSWVRSTPSRQKTLDNLVVSLANDDFKITYFRENRSQCMRADALNLIR
jgi:hypothetical protein